jgi:hypothetical protein
MIFLLWGSRTTQHNAHTHTHNVLLKFIFALFYDHDAVIKGPRTPPIQYQTWRMVINDAADEC